MMVTCVMSHGVCVVHVCCVSFDFYYMNCCAFQFCFATYSVCSREIFAFEKSGVGSRIFELFGILDFAATNVSALFSRFAEANQSSISE
jgi:hypothetical protein